MRRRRGDAFRRGDRRGDFRRGDALRGRDVLLRLCRRGDVFVRLRPVPRDCRGLFGLFADLDICLQESIYFRRRDDIDFRIFIAWSEGSEKHVMFSGNTGRHATNLDLVTIFFTFVAQIMAAWGEECAAFWDPTKPNCAKTHEPTGLPLTCADEGENKGYCTLVSWNKAIRGGVAPHNCVYDTLGLGCRLSRVIQDGGGWLAPTRTVRRDTDKLALCGETINGRQDKCKKYSSSPDRDKITHCTFYDHGVGYLVSRGVPIVIPERDTECGDSAGYDMWGS